MRDKFENEVSFERMKQGLSKRAKFRDEDVRSERKQKQNRTRKDNHRMNRGEENEYEYD